MAEKADSCGRKHAAWFGAFLAGLVILVGTVYAMTADKATVADVKADDSQLGRRIDMVDERVRSLEAFIGRQDERLKRIEDDTKWIRDRMEDKKP